MAGKFIIGNRTDLSDQDALNIVLNVVRGGRIFNVYGMVSLRPYITNLINNTKTLNYE
jgi:hypothetical protein